MRNDRISLLIAGPAALEALIILAPSLGNGEVYWALKSPAAGVALLIPSY